MNDSGNNSNGKKDYRLMEKKNIKRNDFCRRKYSAAKKFP